MTMNDKTQTPQSGRVFISSTFRDMHAERDWLAKYVFPELRERCAGRGLDFVDVDLRWGVTEEEAEKGAVLDICLEEIEKSRPLFIGILGERYGWVPLPREIQQDYFDRTILGQFSAAEKAIFNHAYQLSKADAKYFLTSGALLKVEEEETLRHAFERSGYRSYAVTPPPSTPERDHTPHYAYLADEPFGHSVTALEILHGVLRNPAMKERGFFYFRDPGFMKEVPEAMRPEMEAESVFAKEKLARLKAQILVTYADLPANVTTGYPCRYSGIKIYWPEVKAALGNEITQADVAALEQAGGDNYLVKPEAYAALTANQQAVVDKFGVVYLDGLEQFGTEILEAIWQVVKTEYPEVQREVDPLAAQLAQHHHFMRDRAALFIGRKQQREDLAIYADGDHPRPIVVTGPGGIGKSALLASFALAYENTHPEAAVLPFFVGATPRSGNMGIIVDDLIHALAARFSIPLPEKLDLAPEKLSETLYPFLIEAGKKSRVLIVIDALDQLATFDQPEHLRWLPGQLPKNIRLVLSTLAGPMLESLRRRELTEIVVPSLSSGESRAIVAEYLGRYGKKLSVFKGKDQMATLLAKGESSTPLYLKAACEELRLFPRFEEVTERIANLPDTVSELLAQMLTRLEADFGKTLVQDAACLLRLSRQGLTELELRRILRPEGKEMLPAAIWARLFRGFAGFLKGGRAEDGESRVGFYHRQLGEAVAARYLQDEAARKPYLDRLANDGVAAVHDFLQTGKTPPSFSALEAGIYLLQAQRTDDLYDLMEHIFTNEDRHWLSLAPLPEKFLDYGVFEGNSHEAEGLRIVLERLSVHDAARSSLAYFFKNKNGTFEGLGKSRWAFLIYQAMETVLAALVVRYPDDTDYCLDLSLNLAYLGNICQDLGDGSKAIVYFEKALHVTEELVAREPNCTDFRSALSVCFNNLGHIYQDMGDTSKALAFSEKSLHVMEELVSREPDNTDLRHDLSVSLNGLGGIYYQDLGDDSKALAYLKKSLRVTEELVARKPAITDFRRNLSIIFSHLGNIYQDLGDSGKALVYYEKSIHVLEELVALEPDRTDFRSDLSGSFSNLGQMYRALGDDAKARVYFEKDLNILKELVARDPDRTDFRRDYAASHKNIYSVCLPEEETTWLTKAKDILKPLIDKGVANARLNRLWQNMNDAPNEQVRVRALTLYKQGEYTKASELLTQLLQAGYEILGTRLHLARIALVTDDISAAREQVTAAWEHRTEAPAYVLPRLLWLKLCLALLDNGSTVQPEAQQLLGALKTALQAENACLEWTMDPVLAHLQPQLPAEAHALLTALVAALSFQTNIEKLDAFPLWRDTAAQPVE